jgi:Nucleotidyltransferase domain
MSTPNYYPPFITGSVALGSSTKSSDIDLVMYVPDPYTREILRMPFISKKTPCIMYGDLNIILCDTPEKYLFWRTALEECQEQQQRLERPLSKTERCEVHKNIAERLQIQYLGEYSSGSGS